LTARNGIPMCGLPFQRGQQLYLPPAQSRTQGRHLRSGGGSPARSAGQTRSQTDPSRPAPFRRTHADGGTEQFFSRPFIPQGKSFGWRLADLTTGDFLTTEVEDEIALLTELQRLRPAEIIFPGEVTAVRDLLSGRQRGRRIRLPRPRPPRHSGGNL